VKQTLVFFYYSSQSLNEKISGVVLVSVHVRRTDYSEWLAAKVDGHVVSMSFFIQAMDILRQKYTNNQTKVSI
jgi:hypothetical protein